MTSPAISFSVEHARARAARTPRSSRPRSGTGSRPTGGAERPGSRGRASLGVCCSIVLIAAPVGGRRDADNAARTRRSRLQPRDRSADMGTSASRCASVCIYDCLFPHTVGGAERWYRTWPSGWPRRGTRSTYLTLRQWDRGADPGVRGCPRAWSSARAWSCTAESGRRRILPPLVFGAGVLWHLLRHGRRYDGVHTASFPYFSLLAAALARPLGRYRLVVDWHEAWTLALLARVPRPRRRPSRLARPAAVPADPAARVLLLASARAPAARGGLSRRGHGARGRVRGPARAPPDP